MPSILISARGCSQCRVRDMIEKYPTLLKLYEQYEFFRFAGIQAVLILDLILIKGLPLYKLEY